MKINRADRVVHLHAVRDECIAYAIPMQRPVAVPVSGRSPALLSARADPSERASERGGEPKERKTQKKEEEEEDSFLSGFSQAFAFFSAGAGFGTGCSRHLG